ncbi:MAG TPA: T9SS type A sorting domain-containing protein [Bacteroidales bacterium]|nr:T9SS type A sorting domain-containing protein [Bacteroidales bacterium]HPT21046.1 T9SS type A sorting domain-containing protein [Bacteroidales bacterium]
MNQFLKIFLALLVCCLCVTIVQGQSAITATGGNFTRSGGFVSYTAGQIFFNSVSGTNGTVIQGVQQPYEISVVTEIEEAIDIHLICSAFPNPARDFFILKVENYDNMDLSYKLFDANGELRENKKINGNETTISMSDFLPSIYFLKVLDGIKEVKTFKIIKN